jgi:dTDP-4-dehydrorhamnose reductase/UDP-glucose 4-epimerase
LSETAATGPSDLYGRHKLAVEQALRDLLGERLTVLRLGNIFGYERIPGRRTFVALSLDRLAREGCIHYAMSPCVARDFLPAETFASLLAKLAAAPPGGILNVGSGIALPTGRLALWILEGFGRGELVIESTAEKDPYVLDIGRLQDLYGAPCSCADLRAACVAIGRRLASDHAQTKRRARKRGLAGSKPSCAATRHSSSAPLARVRSTSANIADTARSSAVPATPARRK